MSLSFIPRYVISFVFSEKMRETISLLIFMLILLNGVAHNICCMYNVFEQGHAGCVNCLSWNEKGRLVKILDFPFANLSFLSRVMLTHDNDMANLSVCLSVSPSICPSVTFRYQMKSA